MLTVMSIAAVSSLVACTTNQGNDAVPPPAPSVLTSKEDPCAANPPMREQSTCKSVLVAGINYRYAYGRAQNNATGEAVLVDTGGPGNTPLTLNGFTASIGAFQDPNVQRDYMLLEEPWVTKTVTDACKSALSAYYQGARDDALTFAQAENLSQQLVAECSVGSGQWGFTPEVYSAVVSAIENKESTRVTRFAGASFASVRSTYLAERGDLETVILHPYAPGHDVSQLLDARASVIEAVFPADLSSVFSAAEGFELEDRSLPLNEFDRQSAAVYQGYTGERLTNEPVSLAAASDSLWGRYLVNDISAGWLAYWDETCATGNWDADQLEALFAAPRTHVLALMHLPCAGQRSAPPSIDVDCIVVSEADSVTPVATALSGVTARETVATTTPAHRSSDGLSQCWPILDNPTTTTAR